MSRIISTQINDIHFTSVKADTEEPSWTGVQ